MSNPFLSNYSFSPVPFSFRQSGKEGKWGIWFAPEEGLELLIDPSSLCESLYENGCFSHFFLPEKRDGSETPLVESIFIEDPPCVAETYIWEIRKEELFGVSFTFVRDEYILAVAGALHALYRHAVIEGKESIYRDEYEEIARYVKSLRGAAPDYLFDDIRKRKFQKALRLPVEPFHARMLPGLRMSLSINGREQSFSLAGMGPDRFRHELEHLVFHDCTTFDPDESGIHDLVVGCADFNGPLSWGLEFILHRVAPVDMLREDPVLTVTLRSLMPNYENKPIVGFCREKEVLTALAEVFRERYPKASLGRALKLYLRELQHA